MLLLTLICLNGDWQNFSKRNTTLHQNYIREKDSFCGIFYKWMTQPFLTTIKEVSQGLYHKMTIPRGNVPWTVKMNVKATDLSNAVSQHMRLALFGFILRKHSINFIINYICIAIVQAFAVLNIQHTKIFL